MSILLVGLKTKTKSRHIQIDDLAPQKCNRIIKGRRQCLTSEPKGRFLVNNHSSDPPPFSLKKGGQVNFNYLLRRVGNLKN